MVRQRPYGKCTIIGTITLTHHLLERGRHRPCQGHVGRRCGETEGHAGDAEDVPRAGAFLVGETGNCKRKSMWLKRKQEIANRKTNASLELRSMRLKHGVVITYWQ
jgi:hypothetical protein